VLTPADETHHINKHNFKVPFVCGCRDLGEALRRIAEGAAMIRTKVRPTSRLCACALRPAHHTPPPHTAGTTHTTTSR
jgi:pyridoxal biosynthesis lyase PdxS